MSKKCSVEECELTYKCMGYCRLHYERFKNWGDPLIVHPRDSIFLKRRRFWKQVAITADIDRCWEWQGFVSPLTGYGYARITVDGKGLYRAHRIAYYLFHEINPLELLVCHKCDNRVCVNPHHLFLGTALDNVRDKIAKGRGIQGEKSPQAKLTENQVREIKAQIKEGETKSALARKFGVTYSAIHYICTGVNWKHLA